MAEAEIRNFFHSVHLIEEKCKGCVNCIKRCPTEAIRVRDGKAHIIEERCIDCGECVRICPNQAKTVVADSLSRLKEYKFNVALPAPAIYGQFNEGTQPRRVVNALLSIGFDYVVDVALGADLVAEKIRERLEAGLDLKPMISPACPAVVRLIQVRFPNLIPHILPIVSPMRASAMIARKQAEKQFGVSGNDLGIWFITPCPGKMSATHEPAAFNQASATGAISLAEIYPLLREKVVRGKDQPEDNGQLHLGSPLGVGWARSGGENQSIGAGKQIAVDGIQSVIQILDEVERGKLSDIDYIEAQACLGGCVGGALTVENSFITRRRIRLLASEPLDEQAYAEAERLARESLTGEWYKHEKQIQPRPTLKLDSDMSRAIQKMEQMQRILEDLPGLDCGSCGAPNCQALAEDAVRGLANEMDCVFKLRERVRELATEMMLLAEKAPPAMGEREKKTENSDASKGSSPEAGTETKK